jgi:hypothetical protein
MADVYSLIVPDREAPAETLWAAAAWVDDALAACRARGEPSSPSDAGDCYESHVVRWPDGTLSEHVYLVAVAPAEPERGVPDEMPRADRPRSGSATGR